jgi:hypothetical protein
MRSKRLLPRTFKSITNERMKDCFPFAFIYFLGINIIHDDKPLTITKTVMFFSLVKHFILKSHIRPLTRSSKR